MNRFVGWLVVLFLLLGTGVVPQAEAGRRVIIITLDGCVPSLMEDEYATTLRSLWQTGSYSWGGRTVRPSVTLVAHASLLTGLLPQKHGILSNSYRSKGEGPSVPTLFDLARRAGLKTAFVVSKRKLAELVKPGTVDQVAFPRTVSEELGYDPNSPDAPAPERFSPVRAVQKCFRAGPPDLCFVHFAEPDVTGHQFGWGSEEYVYAFRQLDEQLGMLLAWCKQGRYLDNTVLLITSDHGGHGDTHGTDRPEDMIIPWIAWGDGIRRNHPIETPIGIEDTAATAAFLLKLRIPKDWDGRVISEIFR